jgi:hypothetical protein
MLRYAALRMRATVGMEILFKAGIAPALTVSDRRCRNTRFDADALYARVRVSVAVVAKNHLEYIKTSTVVIFVY